MPRLKFTVHACSGEDADYPASELLTHSPNTRGWQCPRHCPYPQEVTLRLECPARVQQIQILSHEYKIATRVELFTGTLPPGETDLRKVAMRRLGHLSFDSNAASGHAARELKSVHVSVPALLLRLVVHKCHVNALNVHNQVGIVALNVLGEPLPLDAPGAGMPSAASMADDELAACDPATAELLRQLSDAKTAAVAAEDFDEAKRLRDALAAARAVAASRLELEARKKAAIAEEDYDLAKAIKAEISAIEASGGPAAAAAAARAGRAPPSGTMRRLQIPEPMAPASPPRAAPRGSFGASGGGGRGEDAPPPGRRSVVITAAGSHAGGGYSSAWDERPAVSKATLAATSGEGEGDAAMYGEDGSGTPGRFQASLPPLGESGSPRTVGARRQQPRGGLGGSASLRAHPRHADDDPVGAAADAPAAPTHDPTAEGFSADLPIAEAVSGVDAKDAAPVSDLLGEYTTMALFSKNWALRDAALTKVEGLLLRGDALGGPAGDDVADGAAGAAGEHLRTLCRAAARALRDKVAAVAIGGGKLLRPLLARYAPEAGSAPPRDTSGAFADVVSALADRAGDANPRLHTVAAEGLALLAAHPAIGVPIVAATLLKPPKNMGAARPIIGRLTVLDALVAAHGAGTPTGVPVDSAMGLLGKCLESANGELRAAAVKSVVALADAVGPDAVVRLLPKGLKQAMRDTVMEALGSPPPPPPPRAPILASTGGGGGTLNRTSSQKASASAPPKGAAAKPGAKAPPAKGGKPAAAAAAAPPPLPPPPPPPPQSGQSRAIAALTSELHARERELGLSHPDVAAVLTDLAALHSEDEAFAAAQPLYERALRIQERVLGPEHPDTVQTLTDLAICHLDQGANERGRPLLERALALQEAALGPDHADVAAVRDVLASLDAEAEQQAGGAEGAQGDFDDAELEGEGGDTFPEDGA